MSFSNKVENLFEAEEEETGGENHLKSVSQEEANSTIQSECSDFQKQQLVYHLIDREDLEGKEGEYFVYDPLVADKSYNKKYDVMIMTKSDSWESYPYRKNAVVAYPNKDKITDEGITFVVIPFNRTRLGVAPKDALEDSFNNVSINLGMKFEYFNRSFNIVLNIFNNPEGTYEPDTKKLTLSNEKFYDYSYAELEKVMRSADEKMQSDEGKQVISAVLAEPYNKETESNAISILEYLQAKGTTLVDMINNLFDPEKNNFKHIPFKDFIVGELKDKEVWFNNKALLVKESAFETLQFPEHGFGDEEDKGGEEGEIAPEEEPTDEVAPEEDGEEIAPEEEPMDDTAPEESGEEETPPEDTEEPVEDEEEDDEFEEARELSKFGKSYKDLVK